jgi:hypothetical protein
MRSISRLSSRAAVDADMALKTRTIPTERIARVTSTSNRVKPQRRSWDPQHGMV